jgi:hypothetical protein
MLPADSISIKPLITQKIMEQGLSLVQFQKDEKIIDIIKKIFKAGQDINSSYEFTMAKNAKLKMDNAKLCEQVQNAEIALSPLAIRPRRVLTTQEKEDIKTAPKGDIIEKFRHKVARASLKVARLVAEYNRLKEENQKLHELLEKKLLLTPIKEDLSPSPTHAQELSPSPRSTPSPTPMMGSPSPSTSSISSSTPSPTLKSPSASPQKKVLHPSSEQIEAERAHPQKGVSPNRIPATALKPKDVEWLLNFVDILNRTRKDMEILYFNPKKPQLSSLELFVKFINEYNQNPNYIKNFPLDDDDIQNLNIGIEYLGGKNRKFTVELLKRSIELRDKVEGPFNLIEALIWRLNDILLYFNLRKDKFNSLKPFAQFINQYNQNPTHIISELKLDEKEIEALNIGIECIGGKNRKVTAELLERSIISLADVEWRFNFFTALIGRLHDLSKLYSFNPQKDKSNSLMLFAQFINDYNQNQKYLISKLRLAPEEIKALNIGIERLGGKNIKVTAELLKRSLELKMLLGD